MSLVCWKCGAGLAEELLPLSRAAECRNCRASLHVCRMCRFFDPTVANSCREPVADPVQDKTRANFCGYLEPAAAAFRERDTGALQHARGALDALFGSAGDPGTGDESPEESEEQAARRRLEDLFGGGKD